MLVMVVLIIWFVYSYQRKLSLRNAEYRMVEALMQRNELKSAYAVIEGQEAERKRIAAELHDNIGGIMSTLKIFSDLVTLETDPSEIRRLNKKVNELSIQLTAEIRKLSHELDLRTLSGFGLRVALKQLCESIQATGKLEVVSVIELRRSPDDVLSMNLYRIIQELFTNTLKHADASRVRIELSAIDDELTMIYEDNGKGFDAELHGGGMGLDNIRKRTQAVEGQLTIDSNSFGTTVIIEIKL